MLMFNNLIDGEWLSDGARAPNVNPSDTKDIVGQAVRGTRAQAEAAVAAAKAAFPAWSRSTPQVRYDILKKASDEILARKDELGRLLSREEGKTLPEGVGEVARAASPTPSGSVLPSSRDSRRPSSSLRARISSEAFFRMS